MANQSGKKAITAEELARFIDSEAHRVSCVTFALERHGKDYTGPTVAGKAPDILHQIAFTVRNLLSVHGLSGLESAMLPDGNHHPAWLAVRDYLHGFEPIKGPSALYTPKPSDNWSPPNIKNPAQGVIASKMVRCAILHAYEPIRREKEQKRQEDERKRKETERAFVARIEQQEADRKRKADEAKRKAGEAKLEKIAKRRGTCGIEFAGASMRFIADTGFVLDGGHYSIEDATVFMYRGDLRLIGVHGDGVVAVDVRGAAYRVQINEGADPEEAVSQVNDWRWRGSESWEEETCPMPKGSAKSKDDDYF